METILVEAKLIGNDEHAETIPPQNEDEEKSSLIVVPEQVQLALLSSPSEEKELGAEKKVGAEWEANPPANIQVISQRLRSCSGSIGLRALPKLTKVEVLKKDVQLFGLDGPEEITQAKLKQARDLLMQKHHPDKGGTNEMAQQINRSYQQLSAWIDGRDAREQRFAKALRVAIGVLFVIGSGSYVALRRMIRPD